MGDMTGFRRSFLAAATVLAMVQAPFALAEPISVTGGAVQLPTSGLIIDLPVTEGQPYKLSGSWALNAAGDLFDTRDVIDEFDPATGALVAGNWIQLGYFNAGGCANLLAQMNHAAPVIFSETLWGEQWSVLNGVFDFENDLGHRPAAALCRENADGKALLLQYFEVDQPETLAYPALMTSVRASAVLAAASRAYSANRVGDIQPTRRPEVKARGEGTPARRVHLPRAGLDVDLPDDGYLWLLAPEDGGETDMLNRLLPTLPEVSVEVLVASGYTCSEMIASFDDPAMRDVTPTGLPDGWIASPGVVVGDEIELIACYDSGADALLAGIFQGTDDRDVSALAPILDAFAAAEVR